MSFLIRNYGKSAKPIALMRKPNDRSLDYRLPRKSINKTTIAVFSKNKYIYFQ